VVEVIADWITKRYNVAGRSHAPIGAQLECATLFIGSWAVILINETLVHITIYDVINRGHNDVELDGNDTMINNSDPDLYSKIKDTLGPYNKTVEC